MGKRIVAISLRQIAGRTINIGYEGENIHTDVVIDCTELKLDYSDFSAVLKVRPSGGEIYEPEISVDNAVVTWPVLESDLRSSSGEYQLTFSVGHEIIKSAVGSYVNNSSLPDPSGGGN